MSEDGVRLRVVVCRKKQQHVDLMHALVSCAALVNCMQTQAATPGLLTRCYEGVGAVQVRNLVTS